jgi:hypothetical protein
VNIVMRPQRRRDPLVYLTERRLSHIAAAVPAEKR